MYANVLDHANEPRPRIDRSGCAPLVGEIHCVQQRSVDIQLELLAGGIADQDGARTLIAAKVIELDLIELLSASIYAVHESQRPVGSALRAASLDPLEKPVGLLDVTQAHEGIHCKRRVTDPAVPVIPVAGACSDFRESKGCCRHQRPELF